MDNILQNLIPYMRESTWVAPLLALVAGLITSVTPCALSQLPLIMGYVSAGTTTRKAGIKNSIIYALGISTTFTILGVLAGGTGQILGSYTRYWLIFLGIIMIFMALETGEITNILPTSNLISKVKAKGSLGAFLIGILSGLFASPCATPVIIFLLSLISAKQNYLFGITMMAMYSLGFSALTVVAGSFTGIIKNLKSSDKYKLTYDVSKYLLALLMLLIGLYLFYEGI